MRPSPSTSALPAVVAAARAGALDHAWSLFTRAGIDRDPADPAELTVKGRWWVKLRLKIKAKLARLFGLR